MAINSKTGITTYQANRSYHLTSRAIGSLKPFKTDAQKAELLERFGNHLNHEPTHNEWGRPYTKLGAQIKTLSFNVMDNHLHNASHQLTANALRGLMTRVMARQAASFNRQSGWRGKVFGTFSATPFEELIDPTQIKDMVAYIELNDPILQFETPFASYRAMTGDLRCDWYDPSVVIGAFGGLDHYCEHMNRRGPAIVRRKLFEWGISERRYPYRPIDPEGDELKPLRNKLAQLTTA